MPDPTKLFASFGEFKDSSAFVNRYMSAEERNTLDEEGICWPECRNNPNCGNGKCDDANYPSIVADYD